MKFGIYLPEGATDKESPKKFPILFYLSGLTCTEENFIVKSGFQRYASQYGFIVVNPDTSPRGCNIEGESESWDFGVGAGFYVDAVVEKWSKNFRMYSYVCEEMTSCRQVPVVNCFCHFYSMGGHGALMCALKNPSIFRSVSAFAPISNPVNCLWGQKAFKGYLGDDPLKWCSYDSCRLAETYEGPNLNILIDQGDGDKFYVEKQLLPENFVEACSLKKEKLKCNLRLQKGYDHSYYFISTFIGDHFAHHVENLAAQ
uniref:S-formylglutathione hydrolase n=1 Tax=Romanomermis culicivorax TaxID=13658 RepID=A0A915I017_ROMCU